MKKFIKLFFPILMVMVCLGFNSCSKDHDDEPSATVGKLSVTNSSTYTLNEFTVIFVNSRMETITIERKGTLKPKDQVSVDIPIGATEYYMGTIMYSTTFFSPNYDINVKRQVLTDQTVGQWTTN